MKIVIYANSFSPNTGGGERYNLDLANSLNAQGDEVTVITPVRSDSEEKFKFSVIRIPGNKVVSVWKLPKILKGISPDILHISGPTEIDFILPSLAKFLNIPVIMTYHADFPSKLGRLYNSMFGFFQFSIDTVIVQTQSDMNKLLSRMLLPKRIKKLTFNGIDTTMYRKLDDDHERDIDLVFVGRMDKEHSYKGHWNFLKILHKLAQDCGTDLRVYIVGGGEDFSRFREESSKIGIGIQFLKDACNEELIKLLNRAKYLILPSTSNSEGFGRIVLEAMYCGTIPIVSRYAGSHELVYERSCGHIIDPLKIEETSIIICKLIRNYCKESPELSSILRITETEEYSLHWVISRTRELYLEILRRRSDNKAR
ncbi:UDP-D-galactose:(glucosyl)lipopolysaccharide-1,6-D-galactosyltransferase [Thermoplasmatales archaeon]|nr:UDP-D-galactose:(glucosyl)lipopolysaccharide-1,6-D-galactosyltransferase [Thermoplasmatales archaeon]